MGLIRKEASVHGEAAKKKLTDLPRFGYHDAEDEMEIDTMDETQP